MARAHRLSSQNLGLDPFPDEVRDRAFWVWFLEADRNQIRTADMLARQEAAEADLDGRDPANTPDSRTIGRWEKKDGWERRAQEHMAAHAPARYHALMARKFVLHELMQAWAWEMFQNTPNPSTEGLDRPKLADIRRSLYEKEEITLGMGMHSKRFATGTHEFPLPAGTTDGADLSDEARMLRSKAKIEGTSLPEGDKP